MIKHKFAQFLILSLITAWVVSEPPGTAAQSKNLPLNQESTPEKTLKDYWEASSLGGEKVAQFVTTTPRVYYLCAGLSTQECLKKKKVRAEMPPSKEKPNTFKFVSTTKPYPKVIKDIPIGIQQGILTEYLILERWEIGDEARLRVRIKHTDGFFLQDILLFKLEGFWKIFNITTVTENEDTFANKDAYLEPKTETDANPK